MNNLEHSPLIHKMYNNKKLIKIIFSGWVIHKQFKTIHSVIHHNYSITSRNPHNKLTHFFLHNKLLASNSHNSNSKIVLHYLWEMIIKV